MPSYTVSIDSNSSTLRSTIFPALSLQTDREWEAALLDFTTYHSIPNITQGINNKLYYYKANDENTGYSKPLHETVLQTGSYEIQDINREFQNQLGKNNFELKANNNLLRTELTSKFFIDFTKPGSIGSLLGFPLTTPILEPNKTHIGTENVNIVNVNTINITCNLIQGSYKDGFNQHILHTFYPAVAPGFKIVEKPHNLVYLPLSTTYISDIELNVLDQDGSIIDFRGESISVRLHIKPAI